MTLAQILEELPTLTNEDRKEILQTLDELDAGDDQMQGDQEQHPAHE